MNTGRFDNPPPIDLEENKYPASESRPSFTREQLGDMSIDSRLRPIRRDPVIHGPPVLLELESLIDKAQLPLEYGSWGFREKANYIDRNRKSLFKPENIVSLGEGRMQNPFLNRTSLSKSEVLKIAHAEPAFSKAYRHRQDLAKILEQENEIESVTFSLSTDGQEVLMVAEPGQDYVLRIREVKLSGEQLSSNLKSAGDVIPETKVKSVGNSETKIALFTRKLQMPDNPILNRNKVIEAATKVAKKTGFVPDINDGNFFYDERGRLLYIDGDIFDHLTTKGIQPLSEEGLQELNMEVEKYRKTGNRLGIKD